MSAVMYDNPVALLARGELDWSEAKIKVLLVTSEYVPMQSKHTSRRDLGRTELPASGTYKRGGAGLPNRGVQHGPVPNEIKLTAGSVVFEDFTGEFRYAVIYEDLGSPEADRLIAYADLGRQQATNARVELEYEGSGAVAFQVAPA